MPTPQSLLFTKRPPAMNKKRIASNAAITIVLAGLVWLALPPREIPALCVGPSADTTDQSDASEFDQRLNARFPIGSMETALARELSSEGFHPDTTRKWPQRAAVYDRIGDFFHDICHRFAEVDWSVAGDGRIGSINGRYIVTCL